MSIKVLTFAAALAGAALFAGPVLAASSELPPKDVHWSFEGPFGHYDQEQLQRGYKVYREVCSACHSMNQVAFRNLGDPGGPFYDPKYPNANDNPKVKAIAKDFQVSDIDGDSGDVIKRPATSADYFPSPFAHSAAAAAANGGAISPDMFMLVKSRQGGAAHVHSVCTGGRSTPPPPPNLPRRTY